MKISIALATYNGGRYLPAQLQSYANQSRLPDELVVCDDNSSDNTLALLEEFAKAAPFGVRVFSNVENVGFTQNFSKAAGLCSGDIVFFSDQDDVWFDSKIARVESAFLNNPGTLVVIHDGELTDSCLKMSGLTKWEQIKSAGFNENYFVTGTLSAVRRDFLELALPIPEGVLGHDGWIHRLAMLLDARLFIEESFQLLRRHGDNTSQWIASSTQKASRFGAFWEQFRTPVAVDYTDRLEWLGGVRSRLPLLAERFPEHLTDVAVREMIHDFNREAEAIYYRNALVKKGAVLRRIFAIDMLLRGRYSHFNGLKSFFNDIAR